MAALDSPIPVVVGMSDEYTSSKIKNAISKREEYCSVDFKDAIQLSKLGTCALWLEYEDLPFDTLVHKMDIMLGNSYCIRKGLIRKSQMAYAIHKHTSKHEDCILKTAVPDTYLFELDDPYYFEESMAEVFEVAAELKENEEMEDPTQRKRWILKPSITNKGAEIFVFDTEEQLREMFEERYERLCEQDESGDDEADDAADSKGNLAHIREWVMQRYLATPLLLYGGRKFHIRTYVVAVGNIRVYVYREMLALFAGQVYDASDLSSSCHITNTCVQVQDDAFSEADLVKRFWNLSSDGEMSEERLEDVFSQISDVVAEVFRSVIHEVTVFQPMRNLFELYGFDFLVDETDGVHFLEANAFPDFRQTGGELSGLIDRLFEQTIAVALDPFFSLPPQPADDLKLVLDQPLRDRGK
jgi:tubulin--tyrosine ligase